MAVKGQPRSQGHPGNEVGEGYGFQEAYSRMGNINQSVWF